jgi:hypothetical protein
VYIKKLPSLCRRQYKKLFFRAFLTAGYVKSPPTASIFKAAGYAWPVVLFSFILTVYERMHRFRLFFVMAANNLLLFAVTGRSQPAFVQEGGPTAPDTICYPFYNGVQMIEIDHVGRWQRTVDYYEGTRPRALQWSDLIPPPEPNEYLFRDTNRQIVNAFNNARPFDILTLAFSAVPLQPNKNRPWMNRLFHRMPETPARLKKSHREKDDYRFNGFYKVYIRNGTASKKPLRRDVGDFVMQPGDVTGLIDSFGNVRIPIAYENILPLQGDLLVKKNGRWGIIDKNEKVRVPLEYDEAKGYPFDKDIVLYHNGKPVITYDTESRTAVTPQTYDWMDTEAMADYQRNPLHNSGATVFMVRKNGKNGFIDAAYREVTAPVYDYCTGYFRNGLTPVNRNKKWGYINTKGTEVIACVYDDATEFDNGIAKVLRNGRFYCINTRGNDTAGCSETWRNWEKDKYAADYIPGLTVVNRSYTYGVVNAKNEVVIPLIYERIEGIKVYERISTFLPHYLRVRRHSKTGIIDTEGREVLPCVYDKIDDFKASTGYAVTEINERFGLVDKSFRIILPCTYEGLNPFSLPGRIIFTENKLLGWMDYNGRVLVAPQYSDIGWPHNGYMQVGKEKLYGMIDTAGKEMIPVKYQHLATQFYNGCLMAAREKKWGFLDSTGAVAVPFVYDDARNFEQAITGVKKGAVYGFIDRSGKALTPFIYEFINHQWNMDSTVQVRRNGKIGFVDIGGREVIPCIYDDDRGFSPASGHYLKLKKEWMWVKKPVQ